MSDFNQCYKTNYEAYHGQIETACECVNANRCSVLSGEVDNIIKSFQKIRIADDWKDTAGEQFENSRNSCINILNNVKTSIETLFTQSEQIYENLLDQLNKLRDLDSQYESFLNENPKGHESNYDTTEQYQKACKEYDEKKAAMEQNYMDMVNNIEGYISSLQSINGCTLDSNGNIQYAAGSIGIEISDVIASNSPTAFILKLNDDFYITIDGKNYFILSQLGYTDDGKEGLLSKLKYIFTETESGYGSSLRAAGCSFCSTFNCVTNLLSLDEVLNKLGVDKDNKYLTDTQSGNDFLLAALNEAVANGYLSENNPNISSYDKFNSSKNTIIFKNGKPEAIEWMVNKYFGDELQATKYDYKNMTEQDKEKLYKDLQNGNASMVVRIDKNDGRFKVGSGHYMAVSSHKKDENGKDMLLVLDSNEEIDQRTDVEGTNNSRVGWVSAEEVFNVLTYKSPNVVVISKKDKNEQVNV